MSDPAVRTAPRTRPGGRATRLLGPAALVSVAFLLANALSYVFTVLAARALAPAAYGELAALVGLLVVGSVPATAVQTAAALHLGGGRSGARAADRLHACAWLVGLGTCTVGLVATPVLGGLLHLPDRTALAWLVLLLLPHTLVAVQQGVLQGTGRYRALAAVSLSFAAAKLVGGLAALGLGGTPAAALAGMTAGTTVGALAGWIACGRPGLAGRVRGPLLATLSAAGALLGFVVLVNLDLLLARHHLPAAAAGEYAVASIVAKVAFWLPQGVGVVLLPRLADPVRRHRLVPRAVGLVAGLGGLLVVGTAALGSRALPLIGGSAYGDALGGWTWLFALLGTLLAVAQLLLYSGIAAADRRGSLAVWAAVGVELASVTVLDVVGAVSVSAVAAVATATAAVLVGAGMVRLRGGSPERAL